MRLPWTDLKQASYPATVFIPIDLWSKCVYQAPGVDGEPMNKYKYILGQVNSLFGFY